MTGSIGGSSMKNIIYVLEGKYDMHESYILCTYSMQVHYLLSIFLCKHDSPFSHYHNRPKTDTCKTCDALKIQCEAETDEVAASRLKAQLGLRHRKAERTYQQLREDTALAQSSDDIETLTFDLQQSLPTPTLTANVVFYKRQLWVYNLGVHNCATGGGYMHMWDESIASRGSQEVISCILT